MNNRFLHRVTISLFVFFVLAVQTLFAQKTIIGTVTEASTNESLIGVNVMVKGKKVGTITDLNGKYSINALPSDQLIFSYIGLEKQEIVVGSKSTINISLLPNANQLQEVVAIGYGTVKKSDLTGSVAVVSAKDLTKIPSASAAMALQGRATGVLVTQSGEPGGTATIRVRGVGSISKSADPIVIVDGVRGSIDGLQPQDIETMQVLKDASASAIYGADGSNGVIIVTTKRGKSGKIQVNLNSYASYTLSPKRYDVMDADEYANFYKQVSLPNLAFEQAFRQRYYGEGWQQGTDWQNEMFHNAVSQNHSLSLAGGGEKSNFNVSLGYNNEDGTVLKSNADKLSIRANSDFILSKYIKVGENLNVRRSSSQKPITIQTDVWDLRASPLMRIDNSNLKGGFESYQQLYSDAADGSLIYGVPTGYTGVTYTNTVGNDKPNPLAAPSLGSDQSFSNNISGSVYVQIDFTNWLMFKSTPSLELVNNRSRYWLPGFVGNRSDGNAQLNESFTQTSVLNFENQIAFKKLFNKTHNVQATAVMESYNSNSNSIGGKSKGFDFESLNTLTNGGTISEDLTGSASIARRISYLGRLMYDYKSKYFLTGSYRSDGVSKFAPKFRRGNFLSGSLAWKITEDFFKDVKQLDFLKLRLGWGQTGNSNIGGGFQYLDQISGINNFNPVFGDNQQIARAQYAFYGMASAEVHWESSEMYNAGLDASLFNSRLQLTAEYYLKINNGLLVQVPTSAIFGRIDDGGNPAKPWYNIADIQNKGIELSAQWRDKVGGFEYGISSNLTTIKNSVDYLPVPNITSTNNRTIVGHSIGALYGFISEGIVQKSDFTGAPVSGVYTAASGYKYNTHSGNIPQPGDLRFKDLNGDGDVTDLDKTIIGKTIPSLTYTFSFDCSYKNFDLNVFLFGVSDFQIYNQQRASLMSMNSQDTQNNKLTDFAQNHWTAENQSTTHLRVDVANTNLNDRISTFWIEDGSFLRVKDLQIGYKLPSSGTKLLGIQSLRVYVSAANLLNISKYKGRDPEPFISSNPLSSGVDNGQYEIPRQFTGGLQISF
jgi:TonB-linked SusC/RagA family outer membrane protein